MVDLDATLGQELLEVAVRKVVTLVPPNHQQDQLGREPQAHETRRWDLDKTAAAALHRPSVPRPYQTQQ
jgi:hypothetical protein